MNDVKIRLASDVSCQLEIDDESVTRKQTMRRISVPLMRICRQARARYVVISVKLGPPSLWLSESLYIRLVPCFERPFRYSLRAARAIGCAILPGDCPAIVRILWTVLPGLFWILWWIVILIPACFLFWILWWIIILIPACFLCFLTLGFHCLGKVWARLVIFKMSWIPFDRQHTLHFLSNDGRFNSIANVKMLKCSECNTKNKHIGLCCIYTNAQRC